MLASDGGRARPVTLVAKSIVMTAMALIVACGQGGNRDLCTTDPSRSTIPCTPVTKGAGCLGRDLGYADDNLYGQGCSAPRQDDTSACATLYSCDVSGGQARWQPVQGF